ncbi:possible reductase [hydrothermal vent metagenome]|uniref:Possible reductase n=1 Tax=hydrothermal vent metagenome TaxID=652676 RepID=A0A1W1CT05_9ZZZZ
MKNIGILLASVNKNRELAQNIQEVITELDAKSEIINLVALDLEMYTSLVEDQKGIPQEVQDFAKHLQSFDAFVVVSPEYNGSMPPVLNNAIAWVSRVGDDFRAIFNQKFIAIASHSGGGGMRGNDAVRAMFSYVGANVLTREILTNYKKAYKKEVAVGVVEELLLYNK